MSNNDPIRWQQRLEHFNRAMIPFLAAMEKVDYTDLERAGVIQYFEVAFEMAWKTLNDLLVYDGAIETTGARTTLRAAHAAGWIDDIDAWLVILDHRHRTTHAYDEQAIRDILAAVKAEAFPRLCNLQDRLNQRLP